MTAAASAGGAEQPQRQTELTSHKVQAYNAAKQMGVDVQTSCRVNL